MVLLAALSPHHLSFPFNNYFDLPLPLPLPLPEAGIMASLLLLLYRTRPFQFHSASTQQPCFSLLPDLPTPSHWFCSNSASASSDFSPKNAYDIMGVPESSSIEEIKASFRKLAKETHPDLASLTNDSAASERFVQILAAYEILSNSEKRAQYDNILFSQRKFIKKHCGYGLTLNLYRSDPTIFKPGEVVEWLKFYRSAINDILLEKKVVVGDGYFDILERDFYSAIHVAFYGPDIESLELLPHCFEAEERSSFETPEVLHLVSGRDLFGMICLADRIPRLSSATDEKLTSSNGVFHEILTLKNANFDTNMDRKEKFGSMAYQELDAYNDLELHISGRVVAVATRDPPKSHDEITHNGETQDQIHVFLTSLNTVVDAYDKYSKNFSSDGSFGSKIPLGTITGLGTSPDEGSCFIYDNNGVQTHVLLKHRTMMVKHLHWYSLGENASVCECRSSRAQLPPSKYWLFEPRCGMHDIGGWYVETFGRDKKGQTIPSGRYWDCHAGERYDKRLHPAMYLFTLAYRTLDAEEARRRKQTFRAVLQGQLSRILTWSKKLI